LGADGNPIVSQYGNSLNPLKRVKFISISSKKRIMGTLIGLNPLKRVKFISMLFLDENEGAAVKVSIPSNGSSLFQSWQ